MFTLMPGVLMRITKAICMFVFQFQYGNERDEQIKLISDTIHLRAEQTCLIIGFGMSCDASAREPAAAKTDLLFPEVCDLHNSPASSTRDLICISRE